MLAKTEIIVDDKTFTLYHQGSTLEEALHMSFQQHLFLHRSTNTLYYGDCRVERGATLPGLKVYPGVRPALDELRREEWEKVDVYLSLPTGEGDGYIREWNDTLQGAIPNTPTISRGGRIVAGGLTDPHSAFKQISLQQALRAWLIAKNEYGVRVYHDEHERPYVLKETTIVYL